MKFADWRVRARALLADGVRPEDVHWSESSLFDNRGQTTVTGQTSGVRLPKSHGDVTESDLDNRGPSPVAVSRTLVGLLEAVACHADPTRWALMYRVLFRVTHDHERTLVRDAADADMVRLRTMAKAVDHEVHRMHAFVRFQEVAGADGEPLYRAWFEPDHDIVHRAAPFFRDRFAGMRWIIATPRGAAAWDGSHLTFDDSPMLKPGDGGDRTEDLWRTYYAHIFNPARLNPDLMRQHMPSRYWRNLPEATEITRLARPSTVLAAPVEEAPRWSKTVEVQVQEAKDVDGCRRCPLWENATQGVEGRGPEHARLMLVGEQPGDEEDLQGKPFVGPAGKVLDRALEAAGIERKSVFVTNAVKHFKWEPRGKRRIHKTPAQREVEACHIWLEQEMASGKPKVIVAMGATAAFAVLGRKVPIGTSRGENFPLDNGPLAVVTYHPSAVLRADERATEVFDALVEDLQRAAKLAAP